MALAVPAPALAEHPHHPTPSPTEAAATQAPTPSPTSDPGGAQPTPVVIAVPGGTVAPGSVLPPMPATPSAPPSPAETTTTGATASVNEAVVTGVVTAAPPTSAPLVSLTGTHPGGAPDIATMVLGTILGLIGLAGSAFALLFVLR